MITENPSPTRRTPIPYILPALLLAFLLRSISIHHFVYPTGTDYGLHLLFAHQTLETGALPAFTENYQLGEATWALLPGAPLIFALVAASSGAPVFNLIHIITFFSFIEVLGTFFLARHIFRRDAPALIAAAITAVLPLFVDMMTWAGYPNLIAISLFPSCFALWLMYWENPTPPNLILLALTLCGVTYLHHLSTLWLTLTLLLFSLASLILNPRQSFRRLLPLALLCALIGFPVVVSAFTLITTQNAMSVLTAADRFDSTRLTWESWARVITPLGVPLIVAGGYSFFTDLRINLAPRLLYITYLTVSLIFMFGWFIGLKFDYTRAIYFLSLPIALGGAALIVRLHPFMIRAVVFAAVILTLAFSATMRAYEASAYFEIVTPNLLEAVAWLEDSSQPDDVIAMGTFLGFQLPRLLDRPQIAALTPDLISNAEVLPIASDATAIMMGLDGMDAALEQRNVRFVMVRARTPDIPDPERSLQIMDAHPSMRLVFRNADLLIYEVRR